MNIFFFQAEDGIRDADVTGVQTCALPIFANILADYGGRHIGILAPLVKARKGYYTDLAKWAGARGHSHLRVEIGRASCRERVEISVGAAVLKKKMRKMEVEAINNVGGGIA